MVIEIVLDFETMNHVVDIGANVTVESLSIWPIGASFLTVLLQVESLLDAIFILQPSSAIFVRSPGQHAVSVHFIETFKDAKSCWICDSSVSIVVVGAQTFYLVRAEDFGPKYNVGC